MLTTHMLRRQIYANVHLISDRYTAQVKLIYSMPCEFCKDKLNAATMGGLQKAYKAHFEMWHTTKEERETKKMTFEPYYRWPFAVEAVQVTADNKEERETKKMTFETYYRRPFAVEAVQVTADNMDALATEFQGLILMSSETKLHKSAPYIKVDVHRPIHDRQTKAFAGDWILRSEIGLKVYTQSAFESSFVDERGLFFLNETTLFVENVDV